MTGAGEARRRHRRYFRLHRRLFAGGAVIAVLAAILSEHGGPFVWPLLVWGFVLFLHYLYVRSLDVDDDWASGRAADVTRHAYDSGHIDIIRERYRDNGHPDRPEGKSQP